MAYTNAVIVGFLLALISCSCAYDNNPLQDFCVAVPDSSSAVFVNGKVCKKPELVTVDDFVATGFNVPVTSMDKLGFAVKNADINEIPGLNTQGISLLRVDFQRNGVVPPHTHPRSSEMVVVLEGTIFAGFVTSNPSNGTKNQLFTKTLKAGDVFVFPIGLIHFLRNVGSSRASAIAVFNSQNPGTITIANSVFGTEPSIPSEVLTKAFQVDKKTVDLLQSQF